MQRSRMATASLAATAALAGGSAGCLSLPVWGNLFSLLLATPGGELWGATSEGAGRLAPDGRWTFYRKGKRGGLPSDGVLSFALAPDGQLWAATEQGLARFGGERFEAVAARLPEALRVRRLAFDEQGRSWLLLPDRLVTLRLP